MKVRKTNDRFKATREFTDREEPRALFWSKYNSFKEAMKTGEPDISVLVYYGLGGIGKSSLLKKLISELDEKIKNLSMPILI